MTERHYARLLEMKSNVSATVQQSSSVAHVRISEPLLPCYTHTCCTHQEHDDTYDLHHIQHLLGLLNGRDEEESATRSNKEGTLPHTSLMAARNCSGTDGSVI